MDDTQILDKLQRLVKRKSAFGYGRYAFNLIINEPVEHDFDGGVTPTFDLRAWVIAQPEPKN